MESEDALLKIKEWFETGEEDSKDIVKSPWEVEVFRDENERITGLRAINPKFPISFVVRPMQNSIRISATLPFETATLELRERVKAYRTALIINERIELVKVSLVGDEEELNICCDLDMRSLGEGEFDEALSTIYAAIVTLVDRLGLEEELKREILLTMTYLISRKKEEGYTRKQLYEFLVKRAGMKEEMASKIIEAAYRGSREIDYAY